MRRTEGSTLALTAALACVIIMIGVFIFFVMLSYRGAKEYDNMTASGALNVGKKAISQMSVSLTDGVEKNNFKGLTENGNGNINLKVYNRLIAKTLIVGLNAEAEGTAEARANAKALYNIIQGGTNSISKRLVSQMNDPLNSMGAFTEMMPQVQSNALPVFETARYQVASTDAGGNANVSIDSTILPIGLPSGSVNSKSGQPTWLKGYTDIKVGSNFTLQAAPLSPNVQPRLISAKDFMSGRDRAKAYATSGLAVPPNAFQVSSKPGTRTARTKAVYTDAFTTVGTVGTGTFQASIPDGYLKVINQDTSKKTITRLLQETGAYGDYNRQFIRRMRQISPTTSDAACQALLDKWEVEPSRPPHISVWDWCHNRGMGAEDKTYYVYWKNGGFVCTYKEPPPSFTGQTADGPLGHYCPNPYFHAVWYPSSGYNNLLGTLMFFSGVIDGVTVEKYR